MNIDFNENCSDHDGPCIDIQFYSSEEAFDIGVIFEKIIQKNKCVQKGNNFIRIPLVDSNEIGMVKK